MKRFLLCCAMLALSVEVFAASIGQVFSGTAISGMPVSGNQFSKKEHTLLFVWATWCGYCRAELPDIAEVSKQYPSVQVIAVCTDLADRSGKINARQKKTVEQIVRQSGLDSALVVAPSDEFSSAVLSQLSGIPAAFWVDRNGEIVEGPTLGRQDKETLKAQFEAMQ